MDDIGTSWPFWKFGLKRDDLFTSLQDQYNTFPSSIQDPEAFHHDVFELSHAASSTAEFHSLMAERKQYRLRELNESLESASFEIIANPALIGTDQWQHAVQLFRTRSLDSLVRYFASYLPDDHPWHRSDASSSSSSSSGEFDSLDADSVTHSEHIDNDYCHDKPTDAAYHAHLPPSPRSMTTYSSVASQHDFDHADFSLTPARTMSLSSASECDDAFLSAEYSYPIEYDDVDQDSDDSVASVSDASETHRKELLAEPEVSIVDDDDEYAAATQLPSMAADDETTESETPTPKPKHESMPTRTGGGGGSFFPEPRPSRSLLSSPSSLARSSSAMPRLRHRDSPAGTHLSLYAATLDFDHISSAILAERHHYSKQYPRLSPSSHRLRRRDLSPVGNHRSRPRGTASSNSNSISSSSSKVHKSSSEPLRSRPRGRRRDVC